MTPSQALLAKTQAPSAVSVAVLPSAVSYKTVAAVASATSLTAPAKRGASVATRSLKTLAVSIADPKLPQGPALRRVFDGGVFRQGVDADPVPTGKALDAVGARQSYEFGRILDLTRRLMTRPEVRKFLREAFAEDLEVTPKMRREYKLPDDFEKIKELSESQFVHLLQHSPALFPWLEAYLEQMDAAKPDSKDYEEKAKAWKDSFKSMLKDEGVRERFRVLNDPLRATRLEWPGGQAAYSNVRLYANHAGKAADGSPVPPSDLRQVVLDFLAQAKTEIMVNVFDFDLLEVADALVAKAKAGVKVTVGIDKNTAASRPEVAKVVERLSGVDGLTLVLVDPVGLNHQKMIVVDWNDLKAAKALFSSGNLTQSCIGPEGDLKDVEGRPAYSVPNANHMVTMDGYLPAQIAAHSLLKTLVYRLRGNEYPLGGAFKIFGEKAPGAKEAPFLMMTFSPKGALGDINRDVTRRLLLQTRGPVRLMQFAFSSRGVQEALAERAKLEKKEGRAFDLQAVGDGPFAVRDWSAFLALSGWRFVDDKRGKRYLRLPNPPLKKILGAAAYEALTKLLRVAPAPYRTYKYTMPDGTVREVNAKLHHKVMISGGTAILGTSFNFSENANTNQEQFLMTNDPVMVGAITAAFDGLFAISPETIEAKVVRRNEFWKGGGDKDDMTVGDQYKHVDEEARRLRAAARKPRKKAS